MLKITYTFLNSKTSDIFSKEYTLSEVEEGASKPFLTAIEKAGYTLVDVSSTSMVHTYPTEEITL